MRLFCYVSAIGLLVGLAACSNKDGQPEQTTASPAMQAQSSAVQTPSPVAALPDVGKLTMVNTTAMGIGGSPAEAVEEALKLAVKQVNGVSFDMSSTQLKAVLAVAVGRDSAQLQAHAFAEYVQQQSGGTVTNFKLLTLEEPGFQNKTYKATVEANIARFSAPADTRKPKIVIGAVRFDVPSFQLAGQMVPSQKVANEVRQQILDALSNTGRLSVLDRELGGDVQQELDMISSGQAPAAESSKMGQAISADLIWTGQINAFTYRDGKGNWALSQRVVNVATRQIQLSNILKGNDSGAKQVDKATQNLEDQMVSRVVSAILERTFPITVASRDGNNVVLSQGGAAVREGMRYQLVSMGQEIKDPQTGQSLGRVEYNCCEVVVDRVGPTMSQGHLENIRMPLDQIQPGGLQLREFAASDETLKANAVASTTGKKGTSKKSKQNTDVFASDKDKW